MTTFAKPLTAAPERIPSAPSRFASETANAASATPRAASAAPDEASEAPDTASGKTFTRSQQATGFVLGIGALAIAGIGIYLSFEHVAAFAFEQLRFQSLDKARLFTIGVDIGIMVLIALDLFLSWVKHPVRKLRYPAWFLTGATVVLNAASAAPASGSWRGMDYVAVGSHGVVPFVFIVLVETVRTKVDQAVRGEEAGSGIPAYRWFLDYRPTYRLWRSMKLWEITSYRDALTYFQAVEVYKAVLIKEYGSLSQATDEELLPLTLVNYGLTLDQAVQAPGKALEQARIIKAAKEADRAAEADRQASQANDAEISKLERDAALRAAQAKHKAATGQADVEADAALVAAQRAATAETEAVQSAEIAEAEERRAKAAARAADARKRAADDDQAAADAEERAADARRRTAVTEAETERATAEAEAARLARAETAIRAADAEERAADARRRAADAELAAVEADEHAGLQQRERNIRKVARQILAAGGDKEAVPVTAIISQFGIGQATASSYRDEAAALVANGYQPAGM